MLNIWLVTQKPSLSFWATLFMIALLLPTWVPGLSEVPLLRG